jgi:hypothetical protein
VFVVLYQRFENDVLQPLVYGRALEVDPIVHDPRGARGIGAARGPRGAARDPDRGGDPDHPARLVGVPLTPEQFHLDDLGLDEIVDHYDGIGRALHAPPTVPAWVDRPQAEHYASAALTEYNEFPAPLALHPRPAGLGGGRRLRARLGGPPHGDAGRCPLSVA